jgi:transcriptional regulator with XRE-family HTH domain
MVADFNAKELDDRPIGDILRKKREERGESEDAVERATRVSKKYVAAIESGDYKRLPDQVYAKNFVKALAAHYGLDPKTAAESLVREMVAASGKPRENLAPKEKKPIMVTPRLVKSALAGLCFAAIAGYFAFSIHQILKPPEIELASPRDNQVFKSQNIVLEGRTEPEVELTVNREHVLIETDGSFKDTLILPNGVSILRVAAKKKHSKENEIYIKVVVEAPETVAKVIH